LAQYLNNCHPPPPIPFVREAEGVYIFGSKRIMIKIEQNEFLLVRVGGGYMKLKDFIE
jgi:Growth-Arrest-Specific Protein 2 Domain.